jgi:hypothetical protein
MQASSLTYTSLGANILVDFIKDAWLDRSIGQAIFFLDVRGGLTALEMTAPVWQCLYSVFNCGRI